MQDNHQLTQALDNLPASQNSQDDKLDKFVDLIVAKVEAKLAVQPQQMALKPYEYPRQPQSDHLPLMIALGGFGTLVLVALINSIVGAMPSATASQERIEQTRALVELAKQNKPSCFFNCGGQ